MVLGRVPVRAKKLEVKETRNILKSIARMVFLKLKVTFILCKSARKQSRMEVVSLK